jgi:membrane-associated phospholipid phosphatase
MPLTPSRFDVWFVTELAQFLGRSALCDRAVQSAIAHNVLGGLAYAVTLFVFWIEGAIREEGETRQRILTILVATGLAILLATIAGELISWLPPARQPALEGLYASYIEPNPNTNCFPSQSTAVYSAVAAGIYSLHKRLGWILWIGVVVLVGLPRIYVGGHFPTDILVGLILGMAAYAVVRHGFETRHIIRMESFFRHRTRVRVLYEALVFCWILEMAVEFRDMLWIKNSVRYFTG